MIFAKRFKQKERVNLSKFLKYFRLSANLNADVKRMKPPLCHHCKIT